MLSDEEKKAMERINYIQDFIIENGQYNADVNDMEYFSKILNLIEKQQKEIEELKITKKELTERVLRLESDKFWDNVVSKDKIKTKIEYFKEMGKDARDNYYYDDEIDLLQSLLEKE